MPLFSRNAADVRLDTTARSRVFGQEATRGDWEGSGQVFAHESEGGAGITAHFALSFAFKKAIRMDDARFDTLRCPSPTPKSSPMISRAFAGSRPNDAPFATQGIKTRPLCA